MQQVQKSSWLIAVISIFILASDQISKYFIVNNLQIGDSRCVCPFFNIVRVANRGISFGFLQGKFQPIVFFAISFAVAVMLFFWSRKNRKYILPSTLILNGAIGNMIDRIYYGSVVDFLDFYVSKYHWPAFNIADTFIVLGTCILVLSYKEESDV